MINEQVKSPIASKNIEAMYPLSPMQQGMMFHSLYAPDSDVYVEQITLKLKGDVNVCAFKSAWQKVVDRYSILRTSFVWENRPTPLQIVFKEVDLPWTNLDWQSLSSAKQEQQLSELLQTQREEGFQFKVAPLMGCTLIHLSEDTYQFVWTHHHILMDGWCMSIIFKEVLSFYEAELHGEACHLPTPTPYRNFITWLTDQDQAASMEFWRENLQGFNAPTPLVVDRALPPSQQLESKYQGLELRLSKDVSRKLQALAQQQHVTLSTLVQASWGLLLSRYSGESDVLFGVSVSGRPASLSGVENMVGLFINTLPLRLQIKPEQQFIPWLEQIQQLMLELQQYSYTPLVEIQSQSEVPGGMPLFESGVGFLNYPIDSSLADKSSSFELSDIEIREQANYPLVVNAFPGDELVVKISYDATRFAEETIERMLGHLQTIFSAIADNPQQAVSELPLLTPTKRQQLLFDWNDTQTDYPEDKCIHQLFEEQVARTPDATAVVFEEQQLTYQQLNQKANQLAHYLQTLGVEPEVLVGICVERSPEMVIAILGVLKAGGAYVPLDPNYPQERLAFIVEDSQIPILITQEKIAENLPTSWIQTLLLEELWPTLLYSYPQHNPDHKVTANHLAYVIYTSGSTGKPKGVAIEHRSLCNLAYAQRRLFDVGSTSRVLQFASISFDASVSEIFMAVTSGATLVLGSAIELMPGDNLKRIINRAAVTHVTLPPSVLSVLPKDGFPLLEQIIVAGEPCPIELTHQWSINHRFLNAYGPTESTV